MQETFIRKDHQTLGWMVLFADDVLSLMPDSSVVLYKISRMKKIILLSICLLSLVTVCSQERKDYDRLRTTIREIIRNSHAQAGVAFIGNGRDTLTVNGQQSYPMMSVCKFHQALAVVHWLEANGQSLDTILSISPKDMRPNTYSPLRDLHPHGNFHISVRELLRYTLQQSDNNACDILFRLTGGPQATDRYIRSLGCTDFSISVTEEDMHTDLDRCYDNWTTPMAAARLLETFLTRPLFHDANQQYLQSLLTGCETGKDRLVSPVPPGKALVGHKTGTGDRNGKGQIIGVNDIGFFLLPNGTRYCLAVFVKDWEKDGASASGLIASISAAVWEFFTHS